MKRPKELDTTAGKFWTRHAKRLESAGLLDDSTLDSFVLLCRTYSLLAAHDPTDPADKMGVIKFVALSRQYQALAKGFGMHSDKPRTAPPPADKDEFGI